MSRKQKPKSGQRESRQAVNASSEQKNSGVFSDGAYDYASLAKHKLFKDIPLNLIEAILSECPLRHLEKDEVLITPGEENHHLYLLVSGRLQVTLDTTDSCITFPIEPGECIGEMSIIEGRLTSAFVSAEKAGAVFVLSEELFWEKFIHFPGAVKNLLQVLVRRMRKHNELTIRNLEQQLRYEHLQKELQDAGKIQANILPQRTPLFPHHPQVDVHATMIPAKEVGGDFFDAFAIDDHTICVIVGDVSGKGMPAALFMVRAITLLRLTISNDEPVESILPTVNRMLCENNEECTFVSLFVGLLDVKSGKLTYLNGGHNPPFVSHDGHNFELLEVPQTLILGVYEEAEYDVVETTLHPGDILFLYTDGVTEAEDQAQGFFSVERTSEVLKSAAREDMKTMVRTVQEAVYKFCDGAPQSDDITMLALRYL